MDALQSNSSNIYKDQFSEANPVNQPQGPTGGKSSNTTIRGRIASIFGFKAKIPSFAQQQERVTENNMTKEDIQARIATIDKTLAELPPEGSLQIRKPLLKELQENALKNTKIALDKEKRELLTNLGNENYAPPASLDKTKISTAPTRPETTINPPPTTSQNSKAIELLQYKNNKAQIAKYENIMSKPRGFVGGDVRTNIAKRIWDLQLKVEEYERNHPEILSISETPSK